MSHNTEIQWTHAPGYRGETWNPWTGCTKVSPGCAHCYIEDTPPFRKAGKRFVNGEIPVTIYPERFAMPLHWKKPRAIFVNSMSDLFHEDVPFDDVERIFAVAALAPRHIYMVLTKRPERMQRMVSDPLFRERVEGRMKEFTSHLTRQERWDMNRRESHWSPLIFDSAWPLRSMWLGVTIENRRMVHRADLLRQTPAATRFISAEPLLGPLVHDAIWKGRAVGASTLPPRRCWADGYEGPELDLTGIDWMIAGGESGKGHRPIKQEWCRALRFAAEKEGTAFFFKQWGGHTPKAGGRELDGRTWDEFPTALLPSGS